MSFRANIAAIVVLGASCAGSLEVPVPAEPAGQVFGGKADDFNVRWSVEGRCAGDSPTTPYEPIPEGTRAQPDGPDVLAARVGTEIKVDPSSPTDVSGTFHEGDCGRHYFTFTLPRATRISIAGTSVTAGAPAALGVCFVKPSFLRIDATWFDDVWDKTPYSTDETPPPCETFVPVGDTLQPSSGASMEFSPGVYELTVDPAMGAGEYDLEFQFEPISDAICGDGVIQPTEGCDDGGQAPLDYCGADCQPQRLDIEPIDGNETFATAQPVDRFRVLNFYAPPGAKEVDVYRFDLAAGESFTLGRGERSCEHSSAQLFDDGGKPLTAPWTCDSGTSPIGVTTAGTYYLRLETEAAGGRSVQVHVR